MSTMVLVEIAALLWSLPITLDLLTHHLRIGSKLVQHASTLGLVRGLCGLRLWLLVPLIADLTLDHLRIGSKLRQRTLALARKCLVSLRLLREMGRRLRARLNVLLNLLAHPLWVRLPRIHHLLESRWVVVPLILDGLIPRNRCSGVGRPWITPALSKLLTHGLWIGSKLRQRALTKVCAVSGLCRNGPIRHGLLHQRGLPIRSQILPNLPAHHVWIRRSSSERRTTITVLLQDTSTPFELYWPNRT